MVKNIKRYLVSGTFDEILPFKCYGCGAQCIVGISETDGPGLLHPMPPCETFMLDQALADYLRKCREG